MTESQQTPKGNGGSVFARVGGFIGRHKKLFIFLAVIAVIGVVVMFMLNGAGSAAAAGARLPQTVTLGRMDLQQIVSGTGTLHSATTREVTSTLSYEITELYVAEGDAVQAGQVLAMLDTTDLDKDIADARKSISEAQASDALSLAQAERKLADANEQYSLDEERLNKEITKAEGTLSTANKERDTANAERKAAEKLRDGWKALYDQYVDDSTATDKIDAAKNALLALGADVTGIADAAGAQGKYTEADLSATTASATYQTKKATADQAQTAYDNAVQQKNTTLRQDSISIENARDSINTMKLKDSAASYQTQLEGYLESKEKCLIEAPVSGTVTAMTAEVGKSAGGSSGGSMTGASATSTALFTIEDTGRLEISSSIPEYDATIVRVGMQVDITSDALSGQEWSGTVKSISPKATDDSGNFTVVVEVTSPVGELAIGMSTKINIITSSENDVFAVPYDAVTTDADGRTVVYVYTPDAAPASGAPQGAPTPEDGGTLAPAGTPIPVETGMETDYYIEISGAGLEEGLLILADPEGKNVAADTTGMGFMMGGGF